VLVPSKSSLRPAQIRWGGRKHPIIGAARLPARYSTRRATTATFRPGPPLRQHGPSPVPPRAPPAVGARAEAEGAHGWDVSTSELGSRPRLRSNFFAPSLSPRSSGAARADGGGDGDGDGSSALARCDMMPTRRDGVGDRAAGGAARGGRGGRGGYDRSPPPVLALSRDSRGGGGGPSAQERGWGDDDGYSYDQRGPPVEGWERARDRVWGGGGGGYDPCGPSAQDRGRIGGGGPPCAREGYHVRGPGYEWQGGGGGGGGGGGSGGGGGDGDGWGGGYGGGECDRGGGYGRGGAFGDRGYYDRGGYGGPDRGDAPQWWGGPGTPYDRPGGGGGGGCGGRSGTGGGGGRGRGGGGGGGEGDWGDRDGAQDDRGYGRGGYGPDRGRAAPTGRGAPTPYDSPQRLEHFRGNGGGGGGGGGDGGGGKDGGVRGGYGGGEGDWGGRDAAFYNRGYDHGGYGGPGRCGAAPGPSPYNRPQGLEPRSGGGVDGGGGGRGGGNVGGGGGGGGFDHRDGRHGTGYPTGLMRGGGGGGGGFSADTRGGGRGGGGGRGVGDVGKTPAAMLNGLISREGDPESLLRLVADELPKFNDVNVATALSKFGKLCHLKSYPRNIAADDRFRGLMLRARDMCDDGRLQARELSNIWHAVAKIGSAGKLAIDDADVQEALAAMEHRAVLVASGMQPQHFSNWIWSYGTLGRMPGAEAWTALEAAVVRVGPSMAPQALSNTVWSYATLGLMPGAEARAALEVAVVRVGPGMKPQEISNTVWSVATLGLATGPEAWAALKAAVVRVGPGMNSQDVANALWGIAKLGREPGGEARAVLDAAVVRLGLGMNALDVANTLWSVATLGFMPRAEAQAALEAAVVRLGSTMAPQTLSNTIWSYATLGLMPGAEARATLEAALVHTGTVMDVQAVTNTMWGVATLGWMPGDAAWAALEVAVLRVGPRLNAQGVANTLWGVLALVVTRGVSLPACYHSLWRAACWLDVGFFNDVQTSMVFQAHLMHTELVDGDEQGEVRFPPWIMHEARDSWMRQAREDAAVSGLQNKVASIIGELGIPHEVERLTNDGYFSVDLYLPEHGVAIEIDGPTHFLNITVGGERGAPGDASRTSSTRTPRTELRDKFLERRHRAVITVPYFEYDALGGRTDRKIYVAEKLRGAGVHVAASS